MLLGELDINSGPALSALGKVETRFGGTTSSMVKMGASMGAAFAGIQVGLRAISGVMAGFERALDMGGNFQDLHLRTGETIHDLVIMDEAMQQAGMGANAVEPFFAKLQNALGGVNEEGAKTTDAFAALKTSADELKNLSGIGQIEKLQQGFAGIADQNDRLQAARNLFGKGGGQYLSLLKDPQVMDDARRFAEPLAAVLDKNAASFDRLGDVMGAMERKSTGFFAGALQAMAPGATNFANVIDGIDFVALGTGFGKFATAVIELAAAMSKLGTVASVLQPILFPLASIVGGVDLAKTVFGSKTNSLPLANAATKPPGDSPLAALGTYNSPASALQKIGGGFYGGVRGADPMLAETQRIARGIDRLVQLANSPIGGNTMLDLPAV